MDLHKAIQELYEEKRRIEEIIERLEQLQAQRSAEGTAPRRRGRKSMSAEERAEVSRRMKQYWANRRKMKAASAGQGA